MKLFVVHIPTRIFSTFQATYLQVLFDWLHSQSIMQINNFSYVEWIDVIGT